MGTEDKVNANAEMTEEITEEMLAGPEYGAAIVNDPGTGNMVILWIKIHRDTFQKCEYVIPAEAAPELRECLDSMKTIIKDQAIISLKLLKEEDILAPLGLEEVTESYRKYSTMALCALNLAFDDHLKKRFGE